MKIKNFVMVTGFIFGLALALIVEAETPVDKTKKTDANAPVDSVPWKWEGAAAAPRVYKPEDVDNPIYMGSDGKLAGRGDPNRPASEAYRIGMGWHSAALQAAPYKDRFGLVDWVKMVDKQIINPIGSLVGADETEPQMDMDVVISPKGDFIKEVIFSHNIHTYWIGCSVCHDKLFVMAKGENKMSMKGISEGKWCGACHGKISFPLVDCIRCHSKARVAAGK